MQCKLGGAAPSQSRLRRDSCLAAARSRRGSDSPPDCHSLPRRRFATLKGEPRWVRWRDPSLPAPPCPAPVGRGERAKRRQRRMKRRRASGSGRKNGVIINDVHFSGHRNRGRGFADGAGESWRIPAVEESLAPTGAMEPRKRPVGQGHAPAVGKPLTCGAISTVRTGGRPMVAPTMGVGRLHNHLPLPVGEVARR